MFEFESAEQREIRTSTRKLAQKEIPRFQQPEFFNLVPRDLFKSLSAQGLTGLSIEEKFGGLSAGAVSSTIVMEELAAVDLGPAIFISVHNMVCGLLSRFCNEEQKSRWLPDLASGKLLAAFALTEPDAGSDAASLKSEIQTQDGGFRLSGGKCYISSAGSADMYLVFAREKGSKGAQGISAFVVEKDREGLIISKADGKMGAELSPIASLTFNNVFLPNENLVGSLGLGFKIALSGLAGGRVNIAAAANGISRTAIELSLAHLKQRKQFGQALAEFQGLQFILSEMQMKLEAAQLLTWQAACDLETAERKNSKLYPSIAKCFATDAAMDISTQAVQLLGGAGYLKDYKVERLMREAKMLQIVEGTNQIQKMLIARELIGGQ